MSLGIDMSNNMVPDILKVDEINTMRRENSDNRFAGNTSSIPSQTLEQKLEILSDAAKYDVACTSSGVDRAGKGISG